MLLTTHLIALLLSVLLASDRDALASAIGTVVSPVVFRDGRCVVDDVEAGATGDRGPRSPSIGIEDPVRQAEFFYDGVRRIAEVIKDPIEGFGGSRPIEFTYAAPDGNGNQTWTDREYFWSPFYVDHLVVQVDATDEPLYALQDANENVVGLVNDYGEVLSEYTLDPYGTIHVAEKLEQAHAVNRVAHQGLFAIPLGGAPTDETFVGGQPTVYYMRIRILDADKDRTLQRDPNATGLAVNDDLAFDGFALSPHLGDFDLQAHFVDGLNTYAYVSSNPLVRMDPSGLADFTFASLISNILARPIIDRTAITGGKIAFELAEGILMEYSGTMMGAGLMGGGTIAARGLLDDLLGPVGRFIPEWVTNGGNLVSWLKELAKGRPRLPTSQLDEIVRNARQMGVAVRLDPPHPNMSNWNDVWHLNIGAKGQVHLEVPEGYRLP